MSDSCFVGPLESIEVNSGHNFSDFLYITLKSEEGYNIKKKYFCIVIIVTYPNNNTEIKYSWKI